MEQELEIIKQKFPLFTNGRSTREIRHTFFSTICTHLQAYILGFIASDGCLNEARHAIIIQLSTKDEQLLDLFKIISPDAKITYKEYALSTKEVRGKYIRSNKYTRLVIHSKLLYNDIVKLGITDRKTYKNLHIPEQIPNEFVSSFILGYLDGDGYITSHLNSYNKVACKAGICAKTNSLLLEFQQIFAANNIKACLSLDKRDNVYYLDICAKDSLQNLYNYLYSNNLGLSRKRTKLFEFLYENDKIQQLYIERKKQKA